MADKTVHGTLRTNFFDGPRTVALGRCEDVEKNPIK